MRKYHVAMINIEIHASTRSTLTLLIDFASKYNCIVPAAFVAGRLNMKPGGQAKISDR